MAKAGGHDISRIVVSCDTSPLGTAALDAAVALARRLDAEVAGLFVEDINLLRLAGLPFAREYALASAASRRVESGELERTLRLRADAIRGALSRAAQALSVPWSFQVVRGALLDSVLEAMHEPDLAVFGWSGQFAVTPGARTATPATVAGAAAMRHPIVTLYDDTPAADRALGAAQVLAQAHHTGLVVLLIAGDAAQIEQLRGRAQAQLLAAPLRTRFQALHERDCAAIKRVVENHYAAALLWHGMHSAADRKSLAALVDELKCPVVLVS
jgi:hypothetical protein